MDDDGLDELSEESEDEVMSDEEEGEENSLEGGCELEIVEDPSCVPRPWCKINVTKFASYRG